MKLVAPEKALLLPGSGVDLDYFYPAQSPPRDPAAMPKFLRKSAMGVDVLFK